MTPRRERNGRSHTAAHAAAGQSLMELVAKDEYGFLVPYYLPDFYCDELRVGLEVLEQEGGYDDGGDEGERGSPDDELLLVGRQAGWQAAG
jgi:hypothetical protein